MATLFRSRGNKRKRPGAVARLAFAVARAAADLGLGCRRLLFRARRLASGEASEVEQLLHRQESPRQFWEDSWALLRDFFIPHHGNDHRPHALRPKSLAAYTLAAVLIKAVASGALFLYYPTPARLARIITREIVAFANQARTVSGAQPLGVDDVLAASALRKGQDMLARDYFAHDTPDGRKPWSFIDRERYDYVYAGENLAVDFLSADAIHQAFMRSPSHRANIINPHYQDIGVAVVSGRLGGHETELLVQFFGTRRRSQTLVRARQAPGPPPAPAPKPGPSVLATAAIATPAPAPPAAATSAPRPRPTAPAEPLREPPTLVAGLEGLTVEPAAPAPPPMLVLGAENRSSQIVTMVLSFSNFFLIALAVFLTAALLLNIFIRIRIQHPDLIVQGLAVLSLLVAMALTRLHFLERLGQQLRIL